MLLLILGYIFGVKNRGDQYSTDSWDKTYSPNDKGPYGTFMLKELLDTTGLFGNFLALDNELNKVLKDQPEVNDIYFFVGGKNYLSQASALFLLDFVKNGNTAFISTEFFPTEFLAELYFEVDSVLSVEPIKDSIQHFKFLNPLLEQKRYSFTYIYNNRPKREDWFYFNPSGFDLMKSEKAIPLGVSTKDECNFLKIEWGEGLIFLHSQPYLFTNIMMMKRDGFHYTENVLKHIPPGRVQWDEYNLRYHKTDASKGGDEKRSMLEFVVNNPPLLVAFLLLFIGAILYALFKGKRLQKIIPAHESKANMSLQYISTLSSLYMKEKRHNKLIQLMEKTFLNFIAERYYIHCNVPDDKFINKLVLKSHVPKPELVELFELFKRLERTSSVSDESLIFLYKKIEIFYKSCR